MKDKLGNFLVYSIVISLFIIIYIPMLLVGIFYHLFLDKTKT